MSSPKTTPRMPAPEKPDAIRTRSTVIAVFWLLIIFIGFPIWWKTTSIYRARLPIQEMIDWAEGKTCRPVFPLEICFQTPSMPDQEAQHLIRDTQHTLDDMNEFSAHHLRLKLTEAPQDGTSSTDDAEEGILGPETEDKSDIALTVRLVPEEGLAAPRSELHSTQLTVFYSPSQVPAPSTSSSLLSSFVAQELQKLFSEEKATIAHILSTSDAAGFSSNGAGQSSTANPHMAETISRRLRRSLKYAETYHLSFSLFTPASDPSFWDIEAAVQEYMAPVLKAFAPISNFSIDTQVQIYATFARTAPLPEYDESQSVWTLQKDDLSAFVNAAEWPLSPSIGTGPTINFILYVPSPSQSPLTIKDESTSASPSWIIPQWGGVVVLNPPLSTTTDPVTGTATPRNPAHLSKESLRPAFLTFSHQLITLLGTPTTPASLSLRLQSLIRIRAATLLLSASSTMGSLARLADSLPSIPIPATVASSVATTLSHLGATCSSLRDARFRAALATARVAEKEAESSFFEKSMVGQVYFPDEHKVAVYLPLLGPVGVPLVLALLKEVKRVVGAWKARGRMKSAASVSS